MSDNNKGTISAHYSEISKEKLHKLELDEARKAGLASAEVDEDGKENNPRVPHYMSYAPWYLNADGPSLKHQRKRKSESNHTKSWYDRGAKTFLADKYRPGACENCGAMSHNAMSCMERPRKMGAKWTNKNIAPDEKIENSQLDYDAKHDLSNGYDPKYYYALVVKSYEAKNEARRNFLKKQQLKKLEEKNSNQIEEDYEDALKVDEDKVDESKQMDFAKVEKCICTTGGGSTGTVR
ncbi:hypothetical protein ACSBR1_013069 [Camellia fascicularis]